MLSSQNALHDESRLHRWCAWYEKGGLKRLEDRHADGNNAKLIPEQCVVVIERVTMYRPDQFLLAEVCLSRGEFWTVSDMQIGLPRRYGVT
jgi:hypothetical protein